MAREDALTKTGSLSSDKTFKMIFGNIYAPIKNPRIVDSNNRNLNFCHQWGIYLTLNNDIGLTKLYIESVTYTLDSVYKDNVIKITEPPFLLSRSAFGQFVISVEVNFNPKTDLEPVTINHLLCFDKNGK